MINIFLFLGIEKISWLDLKYRIQDNFDYYNFLLFPIASWFNNRMKYSDNDLP